MPRRPLVIVVLVGLCVSLVTVSLMRAAHASAPTAGSASNAIPRGALRVYKLGELGTALVPLNVSTLAVMRGQQPIVMGSHHSTVIGQAPTVIATPDGSKFAVSFQSSGKHWRSHPSGTTLQLFNARTGKPLSARHHPAIPFWLSGISADGSRLFGTRSDIQFNNPCAPTAFYVLDAYTGRVLHHTTTQVRSVMQPWLTDPSLHYLYLMNEPDEIDSCQPWHGPRPTVIAYDLVSGRQTRRIRLDDVQAGIWRTSRPVLWAVASQTPGFALSPDGSQLAVLDGPSNTLTLLDARTLKVQATEHLSDTVSLWDRLASIVGLVPPAAEAKDIEGMFLQMRYMPDGRSLIVTGSRSRILSNRRFPVSVPLGLRLVDIASGHVAARVASQKDIQFLWPAPDGSALYTLIPGGYTAQLCPCTIQRRDPIRLTVVATHTFQDDSGLNIYFLRAPGP